MLALFPGTSPNSAPSVLSDEETLSLICVGIWTGAVGGTDTGAEDSQERRTHVPEGGADIPRQATRMPTLEVFILFQLTNNIRNILEIWFYFTHSTLLCDLTKCI